MLDAGEIDDFRLILMYLKHNTYNYVIILWLEVGLSGLTHKCGVELSFLII